jgi:cytoplasmic iron level regulating protein YaaA (DUF328/UPF0246 family)
VLLLLPPSETKRDGGLPGSKLDLAALSFPSLTRPRRQALAGLRSVSGSLAASSAALKLGPTQRFEIERNRTISRSPTMPAIERYTGVLFDALGVETLDAPARAILSRVGVVHSALFGLVRADDPLPAYRFSHDSRIPQASLAKIWRDANAAALDAVFTAEGGLVLDLRSESYVHLGPAPAGSFFLRVLAPGPNGTMRALNHFNKHGKGELVRALVSAGRDFGSLTELLEWAPDAGIRLEATVPGEIALVV